VAAESVHLKEIRGTQGTHGSSAPSASLPDFSRTTGRTKIKALLPDVDPIPFGTDGRKSPMPKDLWPSLAAIIQSRM